MAKSVDEITLKVGVEGAASLDQLNSKLGNIDDSTKSAAESLKQFNVRNVAYQIQDLAVQLSMGTNAFMALGQQLPQLLSGFGVAGAVIGAVAAVIIPLLQKGLQAAGFEMRSLGEITKDTADSISKLQDAQRSNLQSLDYLRTSYGNLSESAKAFFEIQQKGQQIKTEREAAALVKELADSYQYLGTLVGNVASANDKLFGGMFKGGLAGDLQRLNQWWQGISPEQAQVLSEKLKGIDKASPKETVDTLNEITKYLIESSNGSDKFLRTWEKTISPILEVNKLLVKQQEDISASAKRATELNTALLGIQNTFQPNINESRRSFDQIKAIRLEGEQRIAEYTKQVQEKTAADGVNREAELAAFRLRNNQDVNDKVAEFVKSQNEAYKTAVLQNDTKQQQLTLQTQILKLSEEGRLSAFNTYQLEQDLLQNAYNYQEALKGVAEQRRKNIIDAAQASKLEKEAADIREKSDQASYAAAERRQRSFIETQNQLLGQDKRRIALTADSAAMSDREKRNAEAIFNLNEERQKQILGLQQLNDPVLRLVKEKEINDVYDQRVESLKKVQQADKDVQENFMAGWSNALANYVEESQNAFKRAQTLFSSVTKGMEDMLVSFFKTGKLGWKDFTASIVEELLRSQIRSLISKTFNGLGSIGGGGAQGGGGLFGGAIIPGLLATGGLANANQPYIVGEKGPELFVPNSTGTVVPNNALQGGATNVVYNISAVDAMSFKSMLAKDPAFLYSVTQMGAKTIPGRA